MYFHSSILAINGGAVADVEHALVKAVVQAHPYGINPIGGNKFVAFGNVQVGSRKAQLATNLVALHHAAFKAVRAPQVFCGHFYLARSQRIANTGGANANIIHIFAANLHHLKTIFGFMCQQMIKAAFAVFAKPVVVANYQVSSADSVN